MSLIVENITWVWFEGDEGVTYRGRLSDASGAIDLDQFDSINVQVASNQTSALLLDAAVTPDADQTDIVSETEGKGWFSYVTDSDAAAIPARTAAYLMSFVGVDGTALHHFPKRIDGKRTFGKLVVHDPLGA